jgi:hypothetical protein
MQGWLLNKALDWNMVKSISTNVKHSNPSKLNCKFFVKQFKATSITHVKQKVQGIEHKINTKMCYRIGEEHCILLEETSTKQERKK